MDSSTTAVVFDVKRGADSDAQTTNSSQPSTRPESPTSSSILSELGPPSNPQTPAPITLLSSTATGGDSSRPVILAPSTTTSTSPSSASPSPPTPDVDPQIIEALKSKDRIYVLKLGEQMESLIKEKRSRVDLTPTTSYQRLLVHRCSAYYRLAPETDPVTKTISVQRTPDSRIPERRMSELVPPESSSQPTFKIMRRSQGDRRTKAHSQAGSVAGEEGDLSDVEPSEAGSLGGRSSATGSSKKHMTIQEREAAYNEARSRIFMDFEEKEKAKDMSASSSSLSLTSASASSANGDSLGDLDGSVCSPATESEWSGPSGPYSRDRKDHNRRGNASASSSTRSMRSGYHGSNSNPSSRNSRAPSPSFKYATLYEPAPSQQLYDPNQPSNQMNAPYGTQYYHPFAPLPHGYMPPYNAGYYPPYPGYPPHDPHHPPPPPPDPSRPVEPYPAQHMGYPQGYPPYMWHPPPPHQPPPSQGAPPQPQAPMPPQQQGHPGPAHPMTSPQSPAQYPYGQPPGRYPYGAPPAGYGHPAPGYYPLPPPPPPGQPMMPPPNHPTSPMGPPGQMYDHHAQQAHASSAPPPHGYGMNPNGKSPVGNGVAPSNGRNNNNRQQPNSGNGNGTKGRNHPAIARNPWSFGPGIGGSPNVGNGDVVGPRLTSARRQSNLSGGSSRASSYNDDGLSTTSSSTTTSSSSRRTYTSTASSQHPLPPRPDWAVGLKAQPTLARGSHETTSPRHPPRGLNGSGGAGPVLQPTDFPPLSSASGGPSPERRNPVPAGAWGNGGNRAILGPPEGEQQRGVSGASPKVEPPKMNGVDGVNHQMQTLSIEETIAAIESRADGAQASTVA